MNKEAIEKRFDALVIKNNGIFPENGEYDVHLTDIGAHLPVSVLRQRARELGYVNGYRWGVEYPTDGKKPDIPSGVVVHIKWSNREDSVAAVNTENIGWLYTLSVKVIDRHHKPADTSYLDAPTVKESLAVDWYDYDNQKAIALPPVGVECLTWFDDGKECWQKCKVLALSPYEQDHMAVNLIGRYDRKLIWSQDFKPLDHNRKAEEERREVVDAAYTSYDQHEGSMLEGFYALYDAGYLKLPTK